MLNVYDTCTPCVGCTPRNKIQGKTSNYYTCTGSVKVDFEFYIFIYSIHLNAAEMLNLLLF
jgi:hypothetical protein